MQSSDRTTFDELKAFGRYARRLPSFLKQTMTPEIVHHFSVKAGSSVTSSQAGVSSAMGEERIDLFIHDTVKTPEHGLPHGSRARRSRSSARPSGSSSIGK